MEQKNINQQQQNNKENSAARERLTFVLLSLYYVLACAYIPIATLIDMGDWLSLASALAVCVLGGAALARMAGSFKPIAGFALVVGIFVFLGGAVLPIALLVAFASASCIYAGLALKRQSWVVWILPALPPIILSVFTRSLAGAVLALAALPCSAMLALSISKKHQRVGAICRISAGICAFVAAAFALAVYTSAGELSFSAAKSLIDSAKSQLTLMLDGAVAEISEMLGGELAGFDVTNVTELAVSAVFNLLPAIVITVANIVAYIIHSLFMSVYFTTSEQRKQALPMLSFEMSLESAIIYIAALIFSLVLVSDSAAIYGTAAENVMLVLAPGLILTALAGIRALSMRKGPSCLGTLLYIGVIFMLASLSPYVIMAVALVGAVLTVIAHIAKRKADKS